MPLLFMVWDHRWMGGDGVKEQEGGQKKEQGRMVRWGREILNSREKLFLSSVKTKQISREVCHCNRNFILSTQYCLY